MDFLQQLDDSAVRRWLTYTVISWSLLIFLTTWAIIHIIHLARGHNNDRRGDE